MLVCVTPLMRWFVRLVLTAPMVKRKLVNIRRKNMLLGCDLVTLLHSSKTSVR